MCNWKELKATTIIDKNRKMEITTKKDIIITPSKSTNNIFYTL